MAESPPGPIDDGELEAIDAGLAEAEGGRLIPFERIAAWVESWDGPDELPMPMPTPGAGAGAGQVHR